MGLTKEDIRAIRDCDAVVVWAKPTHAAMTCQKGGHNVGVWSGKQERQIPLAVDGEFVDRAAGTTNLTQKCEVWQGLKHILRVGDECTLVVGKDAFTTPDMEEFGLHGDTLDLRVLRLTKKGKEKVFTIRLMLSVGDNTMRMVDSE